MTEAVDETRPIRFAEGPVVYLPHEEFGLVDLAVILVRRWLWIVAGLIIVWLATYWTLSRAIVRYESRGVVKIGHNRVSLPITPTKDQQDVLLEAAPVAALRVSREYAAHSPLGQKFGGAYVSDAAFERGADELLTIASRAASPEAARDFLNAVLVEFVEYHKTLYSAERAVLQQRLEMIANEKQRISAELRSLEQTPAKADQNETLLAVKQLSRAQFLQQELSLEQESVRLQRDIINLQSPPTQRISNATLPTTPVEPRRNMTWAIGTGLGLLFGCGLAFFFEFLQQVVRRLRQPEHASGRALTTPPT